MKKISKSSLLLFAVFIVFYIVFLRFFLMHWGATVTETRRVYPGDSIVLNPGYINTISVTIEKPPAAIWPWIAQMGVNKGGFYSYTWLENIFGCNLRNANAIHNEWQNPAAGDYEPVCASAEKNKMPGRTIAIVIPYSSFVYKSSVDQSWSMGFYIDSAGINESRVITRMRYESPTGFWHHLTDKSWLEWAHCIMQKVSVNGIKKRAENNTRYNQ